MLSGCDRQIESPSRIVAWHAVLRAVRSHWPNFVWETLDSAAPMIAQEIPKAAPVDGEFFFYPDRDAAEAWERDGGTDENQDRMLHVLFNPRNGDPQAPTAFTMVTVEGPGITTQIADRVEAIVEGCWLAEELSLRRP